MDKTSDSGSEAGGSIPSGCTETLKDYIFTAFGINVFNDR